MYIDDYAYLVKPASDKGKMKNKNFAELYLEQLNLLLILLQGLSHYLALARNGIAN